MPERFKTKGYWSAILRRMFLWSKQHKNLIYFAIIVLCGDKLDQANLLEAAKANARQHRCLDQWSSNLINQSDRNIRVSFCHIWHSTSLDCKCCSLIGAPQNGSAGRLDKQLDYKTITSATKPFSNLVTDIQTSNNFSTTRKMSLVSAPLLNS